MASGIPVLRAVLFHCGFGFRRRRCRHPVGEHNLREGESPAPRGCWGCQLLGREVRQIKGLGAAWDAVLGGWQLLGEEQPGYFGSCCASRHRCKDLFSLGGAPALPMGVHRGMATLEEVYATSELESSAKQTWCCCTSPMRVGT